MQFANFRVFSSKGLYRKFFKFIDLLKKGGVEPDRKSLSELAVRNPESFKAVVEFATSKKG